MSNGLVEHCRQPQHSIGGILGYGTNIPRSGRVPDTAPEIADQGGGPPFDAGQLRIVTIQIVGDAIWRIRSIGVAMDRSDRSENAGRKLCGTEPRSQEMRERRQHSRGLLGVEEQDRSLSALFGFRMLTQADEAWRGQGKPVGKRCYLGTDGLCQRKCTSR